MLSKCWNNEEPWCGCGLKPRGQSRVWSDPCWIDNEAELTIDQILQHLSQLANDVDTTSLSQLAHIKTMRRHLIYRDDIMEFMPKQSP